jgi:hypothetical protein
MPKGMTSNKLETKVAHGVGADACFKRSSPGLGLIYFPIRSCRRLLDPDMNDKRWM